MSKRNGRTTPGVRPRHRQGCLAHDGGRCSCSPGYEAWAYDARTGRKVRKTFPTLAAAKAWRADATSGLRKGTMRAAQAPTLREAAEQFLAGARDGSIRNRSGDAYKPSAIRGYDAALAALLPDLGARRLDAITRNDLQWVADRLLGAGRKPSTIRNALMPLRVIYRRAVEDGAVAVNPTTGLRLPAVRGRRDRIADPSEAAALIAALPEGDRALWATAFYGGLRRGELMALRWEDVDLAAGLLRVEWSYDPKERQRVKPKSQAGRRRVPIPGVLREALLDHKLRTRSTGLVFGRDGERPFDYSSLRERAARAWKAAGLAPITLHEARHTFASLMIAAGVGAKALSTYMGHANIAITMDRYGHLMPGNEDKAAGLLDAIRARADTAARLAQL